MTELMFRNDAYARIGDGELAICEIINHQIAILLRQPQA